MLNPNKNLLLQHSYNKYIYATKFIYMYLRRKVRRRLLRYMIARKLTYAQLQLKRKNRKRTKRYKIQKNIKRYKIKRYLFKTVKKKNRKKVKKKNRKLNKIRPIKLRRKKKQIRKVIGGLIAEKNKIQNEKNWCKNKTNKRGLYLNTFLKKYLSQNLISKLFFIKNLLPKPSPRSYLRIDNNNKEIIKEKFTNLNLFKRKKKINSFILNQESFFKVYYINN